MLPHIYCSCWWSKYKVTNFCDSNIQKNSDYFQTVSDFILQAWPKRVQILERKLEHVRNANAWKQIRTRRHANGTQVKTRWKHDPDAFLVRFQFRYLKFIWAVLYERLYSVFYWILNIFSTGNYITIWDTQQLIFWSTFRVYYNRYNMLL
jgi:hypothetical protein